MNDNTNIINFDGNRKKPAPPVPEYWMLRFTDPTPLTDREKEAFGLIAGHHLMVWIEEIECFGEALRNEVNA